MMDASHPIMNEQIDAARTVMEQHYKFNSNKECNCRVCKVSHEILLAAKLPDPMCPLEHNGPCGHKDDTPNYWGLYYRFSMLR